MTAQNPAIFLQAGTHPAEDVRRFIGAAMSNRPGIVALGDLAVAQNGTPNMSVVVAAGQAFIAGSEGTYQGLYFVENRGTTTLTISAADATNARKDLIVAKVQDSGYSGATDAWSLAVVTGTPAASPAEPTAPANSLVLAVVNVAALASSIVTANITDRRTTPALYTGNLGGQAAGLGAVVTCTSTTRPTSGLFRGLTIWESDTGNTLVYYGATTGWKPPWNTAWGILSRTGGPTGTSAIGLGFGTSETVANLTTTGVDTLANRRYRVTFQAVGRAFQNLTSYATFRVRRGTTTAGTIVYGPAEVPKQAGTAPRNTLSFIVEDTPGLATSQQWTLTMATDFSTVDLYQPSLMIVEDVGPSGNAPAA